MGVIIGVHMPEPQMQALGISKLSRGVSEPPGSVSAAIRKSSFGIQIQRVWDVAGYKHGTQQQIPRHGPSDLLFQSVGLIIIQV